MYSQLVQMSLTGINTLLPYFHSTKQEYMRARARTHTHTQKGSWLTLGRAGITGGESNKKDCFKENTHDYKPVLWHENQVHFFLPKMASAGISALHVTRCRSFQAQQVDVLISSELLRELWPPPQPPSCRWLKGRCIYLGVGLMLHTSTCRSETLDSALQQTSDKIVRVYE